MLRRNFQRLVVLAAVALMGTLGTLGTMGTMGTVALAAQVKEMPKTPVRTIAPKPVDINTALEAEIAAVGIERAVAKKIVEGRPYQNKRDLVTRQLLTSEQYEKVKEFIVAKRIARK